MGFFPVLCVLLTLFAFSVNSEELVQESAGEDAATESEQQLRSQSIQQQKDQLFGLLAQVDERYGDVSAALKSIEEEIRGSNEALDRLRKEIGGYQDQIDKLSDELSGQVRAAYAMGQQEKLRLLLNQQDPALSSRMMVYYEYINKSRLEKLSNIQQTVRYLDQLDRDKQNETELLEKNLAQKKADQAALEAVRKQRNDLVKRLNDDFSSEDEQLSLLKENEAKLVNLIETLESEASQGESVDMGVSKGDSNGTEANFPKLNGDFSSLKGKLPLPVKGKLASMFDHPAETDEMLKGVLIHTHEGAEIKSVTKGKVIYAGALKGYGLLIIVEHDKEFMTLYAFNQSLYKHKGDRVEAGDVIATVGQSGGRSKPGLYFEIRKNGKAVDPLLWCRN